jgi:hypothetical protein
MRNVAGSLMLMANPNRPHLDCRLHVHSVLGMPSSTTPEWQAADAAGLTVATTLNAARLDMLLLQCGSWPGHITAVLYVPLLVSPQHLNSSSQRLQSEHQRQLQKAQNNAAKVIDGCER